MKKLILLSILIFPLLSGCGALVKDVSDAAEEHIKSKWSSEWKPLLLAELRLSVNELTSGVKDSILDVVDNNIQSKLDRIGVDANNSDLNNNGQLELREAVFLLKDIREKNEELREKSEESPEPLTLVEIAAVVAAVYAGGSTLKGGARMLSKNTPRDNA